MTTKTPPPHVPEEPLTLPREEHLTLGYTEDEEAARIEDGQFRDAMHAALAKGLALGRRLTLLKRKRQHDALGMGWIEYIEDHLKLHVSGRYAYALMAAVVTYDRLSDASDKPAPVASVGALLELAKFTDPVAAAAIIRDEVGERLLEAPELRARRQAGRAPGVPSRQRPAPGNAELDWAAWFQQASTRERLEWLLTTVDYLPLLELGADIANLYGRDLPGRGPDRYGFRDRRPPELPRLDIQHRVWPA